MRTLIASAVTGVVAAITAALIVLAVDGGGGTTVIQQAPEAAGVVDVSAPEEPASEEVATRQPVTASEDEVSGSLVVEPEGMAPAADAIRAGLTPQEIFNEVGRSVVSIEVDFGGGSGFFVDTEGHLITNYHVVQGSTMVTVVSADGTRVMGRVLGFDAANDLAVVSVDPTEIEIHPVTLGDSDALQVGEPVVAIGNPFGLQASLTTGVISAIERTRSGLQLGGRPQRGLIQTDAAINPGNSGGVLLNAQGEVIGVTASVESPIRGSVGVGFAIPSNAVLRFLPDMIAGLEVQHPWMGIFGGEEEGSEGLLVGGVVEGSPALDAGLREGDRLLSVDGIRLEEFEQLAVFLDVRRVGDVVVFDVDREGESLSISLELAAWPG